MTDEEIDGEKVELVKDSLEDFGFEQPVVVEREGKTLHVRAGFIRLLAAERSDEIDTVPVYIHQNDIRL